MNKRFELLTADVPTETGRVYSIETLHEMMDQINTGNVLATLDSNDLLTVPMVRVVGTVHDAEIEGNTLHAVLYISESPMGVTVKALLDAKLELSLRTAGSGDVSKDGIVSNYKLAYCFVSPIPSKAR